MKFVLTLENGSLPAYCSIFGMVLRPGASGRSLPDVRQLHVLPESMILWTIAASRELVATKDELKSFFRLPVLPVINCRACGALGGQGENSS